jgi:hypothetical protein
MKNRIDLRLLGIAGAILAIALTGAWLSIALFRYLFPHLAAETFWDELSGLPIAALVTIGIKWLLLREQTFHLLVTTDVPEIGTVNLYLRRRREGRGIVFLPAFRREAVIKDRDTLIRNINWWGVYGVDRCTLRFDFSGDDTNGRYVEIPTALCHTHGTIRLRLGELSEHKPLIVSRQHIE